MDVDGFLEVLRGLRRRDDRAARGRHARAVGLRARHPRARSRTRSSTTRRSRSAARRPCSRGACSTRGPPTSIGALDPDADRARARGGVAGAGERGGGARGAAVDGLRDRRGGAAVAAVARRARGRAGASCATGDRWFAAEASRDPEGRAARPPRGARAGRRATIRSCAELEAEGVVLRARFDGREAWCNRRLLARIHRYTLERLRKEIEPVTAAEFLRFLALLAARRPRAPPRRAARRRRGASHSSPASRSPAAAWEASVLPARVRGYRREWLDQLTLVRRGRVGAPVGRRRDARSGTTPICLVPREDLDAWMALAGEPLGAASRPARALEVLDALRRRGAMFLQELARATRLPPAFVEEGLGGADRARPRDLRLLRRAALADRSGLAAQAREPRRPGAGACSRARRGRGRRRAEFVARQLLARTGVVFRKTLAREKQPLPWRDLARVLRTLEARGEVRGGRFVGGLRRRAVRAARGRDAPARDPRERRRTRAIPSRRRRRRRPAELPRHPDARRARLAGFAGCRAGRVTGNSGGKARGYRGVTARGSLALILLVAGNALASGSGGSEITVMGDPGDPRRGLRARSRRVLERGAANSVGARARLGPVRVVPDAFPTTCSRPSSRAWRTGGERAASADGSRPVPATSRSSWRTWT